MYHSPGMYITITDCSENYQSICLMVDEFTTLETPTVRDMVSLAYLPIVQLSSPKLALSPYASPTTTCRALLSTCLGEPSPTSSTTC